MPAPIYCYFNNGLSWRLVDSSYAPIEGEAIFSGIQPTVGQLASTFPSHSAASNDAAIKAQIAELEASISLRMMREAFLGTSAVISGGAYNGLTAAQAIASVQTQIATLRAELT